MAQATGGMAAGYKILAIAGSLILLFATAYGVIDSTLVTHNDSTMAHPEMRQDIKDLKQAVAEIKHRSVIDSMQTCELIKAMKQLTVEVKKNNGNP